MVNKDKHTQTIIKRLNVVSFICSIPFVVLSGMFLIIFYAYWGVIIPSTIWALNLILPD